MSLLETERARHTDSIAPIGTVISSVLEASNTDQSNEISPAPETLTLSKLRTVNVIVVLFLDAFIPAFTAGLLTASLPEIATSLSIPANLLFWPSSVNALTSASLLLVAGSISDLLGARRIWLVGSLLMSAFILACGVSRTYTELIVFRALQGIASSLCLTTSASLITKSVPVGRIRNLAFGLLGVSQPLGLSVGLVLGGVFTASFTWRIGWYASATAYFLVWTMGIFSLPVDTALDYRSALSSQTWGQVDWIGAAIATSSLAMLSYALALISGDLSSIRTPRTIVLLAISLLLLPAFFTWMKLREHRYHKPALIPNSLWRSRSFTTVCLMLLSSYGIEDTMELLCSLYFQNIQKTGSLQSSLRMLPMCVVGIILNICTGLFIHSTSVRRIVLVATLLSAASPLLMALTNPSWPYWYTEFPSQVLMPLSIDILFTVGILLSSEVFPADQQALAAGVFNTAGQLGISIGLAVVSVVTRSVTDKSSAPDGRDLPASLLRGYKAGFWLALAWALGSCVLGTVGLANLGRIGIKRD